jgi:hypothetical protein
LPRAIERFLECFRTSVTRDRAGPRLIQQARTLLRFRTVLRITDIDSPSGPVLKLEGQLAGLWADELRIACEGHATLDLQWVTYVDRGGAMVLSELARRGVRMVSVPPFIATLLDGGPQ